MGGKYCIENDFAAQKELAEMERASIDEQWMARSELNALKLRAERSEAKLATWQKDMNAVLRQRDDIHNRVARLEKAGRNILCKIPETKNDYSGVGYCFGCGVVKWASGQGSYSEECKSDCALQEFRRALEEK